MKNSGFAGPAYLLATGLAAVVGLAAPAMAQCTNDPTGAVQDNDDQVCGNTTPDTNGGCNVNPTAFQALGTFTVGTNYKVAGKAGTFGNGGTRDLDWYSFTVAAPCKVQFNAIVNSPAQTSVLQVIEGDCDGTILAASEFTGCNSVPADFNGLYCVPGTTYIFLISTPFEADTDPLTPAVHGCSSYVVDIVVQDGDSGCLGVPATARCDTAHAGPGCEDWSCCNQVCFADPLCCVTNWTSSCATQALAVCDGYFYYECNSPVGAPANDCVANATPLTIDADPVAFTTVNAGVDGPLTDNCQAVPFTRDVWAKVVSPSSGNLITAIAGTNLNGTLEFYNLGSDTLTDPQSQLPASYGGCLNITGAGLNVGFNGLSAGDNIYIRYANSGAGQAFTLQLGFVYVVFDTGPQSIVLFNGANANLGLSSGDLSVASAQRWLATPWTVPAQDGSIESWDITGFVVKGFLAAAPNTVTDLKYIVWSRTNFDKPVDGDQVASGTVPLPTPFDDPEDNFVNGAWNIVPATPINLTPGDYYLTVFGSDPTPDGQNISNWAWFLYANNGINMVNGNGPYTWRSATFPSPGFDVYQPTNIVFIQPPPIPGSDPNDLFNVAFRVNGVPNASTTPPCPADLTDDGIVDGADLAIVLGAWGTANADLTGDGNTDGADLAIVLGAWGPCPS